MHCELILEKDSRNRETRNYLVRLATYTVVLFTVLWSFTSGMQYWGPHFFAEQQLLQRLQFGLLILALIFMIHAARRYRAYRELFAIMTCLIAFAALREQDDALDALIPVLGWKIAGVFILLFLYALFRFRDRLAAQLDQFAWTHAFALFWAGFVIAVQIAQLLGHGDLLKAIMGADYTRTVKAAVEEGGETAGYVMLVFAAVETLISVRKSEPA